MRSVQELLTAHAGLHEQFAVHRDFVVGLEFGRALEELERFERELRSHMELEEKHVIPLYEARVGAVTGGDPEFFRLEHKNLLRNLDTAKAELRRLSEDPRAGRRQAHEALHGQSLFIHLLQHHDLRERNVLYPRLDEALSPEERLALLRACGL